MQSHALGINHCLALLALNRLDWRRKLSVF